MAYKPSYLVHWSGKDICTNINNLTNEDRNKYLQRLESIINEGL